MQGPPGPQGDPGVAGPAGTPGLGMTAYTVQVVDTCAYLNYYYPPPTSPNYAAGCAASLASGNPTQVGPGIGTSLFRVNLGYEFYSTDSYGILVTGQSGGAQVYRAFYATAREAGGGNYGAWCRVS